MKSNDFKTFSDVLRKGKVKKGKPARVAAKQRERETRKTGSQTTRAKAQQKQKHHRKTNISAQASNAKRSERPGSLVFIKILPVMKMATAGGIQNYLISTR
jgi:hypothetical protein